MPDQKTYLKKRKMRVALPPDSRGWLVACWRAASSAMRLPEGSRALASAEFFKGCVEGRGGAEAAFERDVGDFFVGGDEQSLGVADAHSHHIFPNGHA